MRSTHIIAILIAMAPLGCGQDPGKPDSSSASNLSQCEAASDCAEPVGGSGASGASDAGDSSGAGGTAADSAYCPYTVSALDCAAACNNLKAIASSCEGDPTVPASVALLLAAAATGTGAGCNSACAANSPTYGAQWKCFQGTPSSAECTAIAGCDVTSCHGG